MGVSLLERRQTKVLLEWVALALEPWGGGRGMGVHGSCRRSHGHSKNQNVSASENLKTHPVQLSLSSLRKHPASFEGLMEAVNPESSKCTHSNRYKFEAARNLSRDLSLLN